MLHNINKLPSSFKQAPCITLMQKGSRQKYTLLFRATMLQIVCIYIEHGCFVNVFIVAAFHAVLILAPKVLVMTIDVLKHF